MQLPAKQRAINRHWVGSITLAFFFIQAVFPAGYMPAALSSGWFLQLCPTGVSNAVMAVLHGDQHANHSGQADHTSGETLQHETWRVDCPFSAFTITKVAGTFSSQASIDYATGTAYNEVGSTLRLSAQQPNTNQPRAPPRVTHS